MKPLYLTLQSSVHGTYREFRVSSLMGAGQVLRAWVKEYDLGASQLMGKCGNVYRGESPIPIANVSYNGRSWVYATSGTKDMVEITDADIKVPHTQCRCCSRWFAPSHPHLDGPCGQPSSLPINGPEDGYAENPI